MGKHENFYSAVQQHVAANYPSVLDHGFVQQDLCHIIAPHKLTINTDLHKQLQKSIAAIYRLAQSDAYGKKIKLSDHERSLVEDPKRVSGSVLMAYDFHLNADRTEAKLVEINTNGSGFPLAALAYVAHGEDSTASLALGKLKASFFEEYSLAGASSPNIAIMDEQVADQKMYIEFLMYKDLFVGWELEPAIIAMEEVRQTSCGQLQDNELNPITRIYNRYCDFTFAEPRSEHLLTAYKNNSCQFSPHPREYILLADKMRLVEWSTPGCLSDLQSESIASDEIYKVLLQTQTRSDYVSLDEIWRLRKKLFFKPKSSFGGKATYRGKSITRGKFEKIMALDEIIIQEYFPAGEMLFNTTEEATKWKYDLRCFVYKDEIQLMAARFYQGQVTNFKTLFSGFAPVFVK